MKDERTLICQGNGEYASKANLLTKGAAIERHEQEGHLGKRVLANRSVDYETFESLIGVMENQREGKEIRRREDMYGVQKREEFSFLHMDKTQNASKSFNFALVGFAYFRKTPKRHLRSRLCQAKTKEKLAKKRGVNFPECLCVKGWGFCFESFPRATSPFPIQPEPERNKPP